MEELNQADIRNILVLISKSTISGNEALTIAVLQQKLQRIADFLGKEPAKAASKDGPKEAPKEGPKKEEKSK